MMRQKSGNSAIGAGCGAEEDLFMEGTKRRAANSLGMFDLLKGIGMLTIVFAHTGELYPIGDASHINR